MGKVEDVGLDFITQIDPLGDDTPSAVRIVYASCDEHGVHDVGYVSIGPNGENILKNRFRNGQLVQNDFTSPGEEELKQFVKRLPLKSKHALTVEECFGRGE